MPSLISNAAARQITKYTWPTGSAFENVQMKFKLGCFAHAGQDHSLIQNKVAFASFDIFPIIRFCDAIDNWMLTLWCVEGVKLSALRFSPSQWTFEMTFFSMSSGMLAQSGYFMPAFWGIYVWAFSDQTKDGWSTIMPEIEKSKKNITAVWNRFMLFMLSGFQSDFGQRNFHYLCRNDCIIVLGKTWSRAVEKLTPMYFHVTGGYK